MSLVLLRSLGARKPPSRSTLARSSAAAQHRSDKLPLEALRARELRTLLQAAGVSVEGLFDKDALLAAARTLEKSQQPSAVAAEQPSAVRAESRETSSSVVESPLVWRQAASLYAGIQTQQGSYAALQLASKTGQLTLIVDSAASTTIVTPACAARLRPPRTGVTAGPGVSGTGATEPTHQVLLGELRSVPGGQLLLAAQRSVVLELPTGPDTDGILGLDFLSAFDAVDLRWSPPRAAFHPRGSHSAQSWAALVSGLKECILQPAGLGLLTLSVRIEGSSVTMPALLDTGAVFSSLNLAASSALGLVGGGGEEVVVAGVAGVPLRLRTCEREIRLSAVTGGGGSAELGAVRPLVGGDLPAFVQLGLSGQQALLLGLDVLMQRPRVVLSTATRRMLF